MRMLAVICCLFSLVLASFPAAALDSLNDELVYRTNLGRAEDVAMLLKQQGASPDMKDNNGTPLIALAAARKDKEGLAVVRTLLDAKADIDARDSTGQTALFYAAQRGNMDMVKLLLLKGINYYAMDNTGNIARTIAHNNGHDDVMNLMDEFVKYQTIKRNTEYQQLYKTIEEQGQQQREATKKAEEAARAAAEAMNNPQPTPSATPSADNPAPTPVATAAPNPAAANPGQKPVLDKAQQAEADQLLRDYSFNNCAYQYWYFIYAVKQSSELEHDALNDEIDNRKNTALDERDQLKDQFGKNMGQLNRVADSAKQRIFNQLNAMPSKADRHEEGVGKRSDMEARCKDIAHEWDLAPPGVKTYNARSSGGGGGGGIGLVGGNEEKAQSHKARGGHAATHRGGGRGGRRNGQQNNNNNNNNDNTGQAPSGNNSGNGLPTSVPNSVNQSSNLGGSAPRAQNPYNVHPGRPGQRQQQQQQQQY